MLKIHSVRETERLSIATLPPTDSPNLSMQLLINHSPVNLSSSGICCSAVITGYLTLILSCKCAGGRGLHGAGSSLYSLLALCSPDRGQERLQSLQEEGSPGQCLIHTHTLFAGEGGIKSEQGSSRSPKGSWGHSKLGLAFLVLSPR